LRQARRGCWHLGDYISYTQQPAQAFLFPRLISTVFVVLALWTFGKALLGRSKVGNGLSREAMINIAARSACWRLIYIFWAAKALGFYTATAQSCLLSLLSIYDPAPHWRGAKSWIRRRCRHRWVHGGDVRAFREL
jgi:hypothetical protein